MIKLKGDISFYETDSLSSAVVGISKWVEKGLANERDVAGFIIQLFHQIPEPIYNDIIEKS